MGLLQKKSLLINLDCVRSISARLLMALPIICCNLSFGSERPGIKLISIQQLQASQFYWARQRPLAGAPFGELPELEVLRISTIFGSAQEFWTVAVSGSEEHFDL